MIVRVTRPNGTVILIRSDAYAALADAGLLGHHTAERVDPIMSLPEVRRRIGRTQTEVALAVGTTQSGVSRMERQSDMRLSTLDEYVSALGGHLRLVIEHPAVSADLSVVSAPARRGSRPGAETR